MTREEAIKIIKECKEKGFKYTFYTFNEYDAALDMAIKALMRDDTFLDKVLEIINRVRLEIDGEPEDEKMESTWNRACDLIEKYVLALKGEQA